MRNGFHALSLVVTLLASSGAWAEPAAADAAQLNDATFAARAAQDNLAELKRSQLAAARSESPQLRLFAEQQINECTETRAELLQLADRLGLILPSVPTPLQSSELATLKQQQGRQFDTAYLKQLQRDQDATARLLERAAGDEQLETGLRDFARRALPGLRDRQRRAGELNGAIAGLQTMPMSVPSRRIHHVW